jgi:hypothetical protein
MYNYFKKLFYYSEPGYTVSRKFILNNEMILELGVNKEQFFRLFEKNILSIPSQKILNSEKKEYVIEYTCENEYKLIFLGHRDYINLYIIHPNKVIMNKIDIKNPLNRYKQILMNSNDLDILKDLFIN